jgi:RimJ/RimL family protein N-acetyltransferase
MSVIICIIPDVGSDNVPEAISVISLRKQAPGFAHYRTYKLAITIAREYQGRGYRPEAISWMLDWSFLTARLHRVELTVSEWNKRAQKAYQKLSFVTEGQKREYL